MARKKKTKTTESRVSKTGLGYTKPNLIKTKLDGISEEIVQYEKRFWSKICNGFKKFLEPPFKS